MPKRMIRLSGLIAAPCKEWDGRIFQEQRHFFLNARLSAIKHSCAKTPAYMPATPIRVDVLDQAPVRIRNSSSNCLAVFRPGLSKPSVNRSYTGASTSRASPKRPCVNHNRAIIFEMTILGAYINVPFPPIHPNYANNPATGQPFLISEMAPAQLWSAYIRYIGAGAVLASGLITLARTIPTIISSARESLRDLSAGSGGPARLRTDRDIPMTVVIGGSLLLAVFLTVTPGLPTYGNAVAAVLILIFGFFFSTVSSRITGLIGTSSNPISGMTIATLILTCLLFVALGWTGDMYSPIALGVGAIVCIAAANAGNTSQDLKTGYIVGATPLYQQIGLVIGVIASASVIGLTILYLHNNLGGIGSPNLAAPQATLMATIIKGLLNQNLPWGLVLIGVFLSIVLELCGVRSLTFAVGSYLPIATTAPIFAGGLVRWWVERTAGKPQESDLSAGVLLSSGLIAGGSITGILYAVLVGTGAIAPFQSIGNMVPFLHSDGISGQVATALLFLALAVVVARTAIRKVE